MSNLVIDKQTKRYSRYTHSENEILKLKLRDFYNCNNITITNSGLHSNFLALNTIINTYNDCHIIYINELYHETINIINFFKENNICNSCSNNP